MAKELRIPTEQLSEETQQLYDVLNCPSSGILRQLAG
jgi:hypothetical protein